MTTTTTTDLTAANDEAMVEKAHNLAESAASDLYNLFNEDNTTFTRAKRIVKWLDKGADIKLIATHLSVQRAERLFPEETPEKRAELADLAPTKGGVKVADTTIRAYSTAWEAVMAADLIPTEDSVAWAFKVKSKGRTAGPLKALIEGVKASVESGESDQPAGTALFVTGAKAILAGRVPIDEAKPRTKKVADEPEEGGEVELSADVPMSIEVAVHNLKVILAQDWSDDEFAVLAAAIEESLAGRTVEV